MSKYMVPIFIMVLSIPNMAAVELPNSHIDEVYIIPNEMQQWVDPIDNQYYCWCGAKYHCQPPTSHMEA